MFRHVVIHSSVCVCVVQNEVELGELLLSLNYLPSAGRLNVDVIRAKQLLQTDMCQGSGTSGSSRHVWWFHSVPLAQCMIRPNFIISVL